MMSAVPTKVMELLPLLMHELSIFRSFLIINMNQVQHQWSPSHNTGTTWQEIPSHNCLKH